MTGTYGITITNDVATITLSVPALWLLAITVLSGVFMTYTTVRDWLAGVLARVWQEDKQADTVFKVETAFGSLPDFKKWNASTTKGPTNSGGTKAWE